MVTDLGRGRETADLIDNLVGLAIGADSANGCWQDQSAARCPGGTGNDGATPPRYDYTVRRSARARRARLTVSERGEVVVVLPRRAPLDEAARIVGDHGAWLDRHVARMRVERDRLMARPALGPAGSSRSTARPWSSGSCHARSGGRRGSVQLDDGRLLVRPGLRARRRAHARALAARQARTRLSERVLVRAPELGVRAGPTEHPRSTQPMGLRVGAGAISRSAGASSWHRRSCSTWSSSTNSLTCASAATRARSGRSWSGTRRGRGKRAAGCGEHAREVRAALD